LPLVSNGVNLLYITNARIPTEKAHGIQIMKMCEAFTKAGIEQELIIPGRFNWIKEDPFDYYGIARNFKIKKLPCFDLIPFHKHLGHFGLWLESLTFFFSAVFYLFFKKRDFVIYTRDKFLSPISFFKKNLIFEAHSFPGNYFLYSLFLKRLKGVVVITEKLKERFMEHGIAGNKILVAPDGVDFGMFDIGESQAACREKLGLPQDKKIVLYTGHLYEWKGANTLLEAARNFQFSISNFQFIFVGGTKEDIESFKDKARDLKNVLVVGHRHYSEIPYWLKAADVLVLPNSGKIEISRHWTSPMKLFEYMASKRPIVASDLPSIREILNEQNSVLAKPDNPEQLAQAIKEVLQNHELSDRISAKSFEDAKEFTWQKRAEKIYEYFFKEDKK